MLPTELYSQQDYYYYNTILHHNVLYIIFSRLQFPEETQGQVACLVASIRFFSLLWLWMVNGAIYRLGDHLTLPSSLHVGLLSPTTQGLLQKLYTE